MFSTLWYNQWITTNLFSAQALDANSAGSKAYLAYKLNAVGVEGFLPLASQFFYLFLLTNRTKPFFSRKYPSKKKNRFGVVIGDTAKYAAYVNQQHREKLAINLYTHLMKYQLSPEKSSVWFNSQHIKIIAWNVPLTNEMAGIQINQNAFLPDMPMYYKFMAQHTLSSETLFWVKFYEFLRPTSQNLWYLQLQPYHYLS